MYQGAFNQPFLERVAREWARIDGEDALAKFEACSVSRRHEEELGVYAYYMRKARYLLKRINLRDGDFIPGGFVVVKIRGGRKD